MTNKEKDPNFESPKNNNISGESKLILFNDDENTFDYVIESLMDVCQFEDTQAAQVALLAHYKGKITVKVGEEDDLTQLKHQLDELGLTVEVI